MEGRQCREAAASCRCAPSAAPRLSGRHLSRKVALMEQLQWPFERLSAKRQVKQRFQHLLGNMGPSSFLLTGTGENTGSWSPPRITNPS